nr:hypothetical protein [Providencia rettgeri]
MIMYASDFEEIPSALKNNVELRNHIISLIKTKNIVGKVTEGSGRLDKFRVILTNLVNGQSTLADAIATTESELERYTSNYPDNNRVFAKGWAERLVRTQLSRFYNQSIMEMELSKGRTECYVPPSRNEDASSNCSQILAGKSHDISHLLNLLVSSYENGVWGDNTPKIPDHPHCTHVVKPISWFFFILCHTIVTLTSST